MTKTTFLKELACVLANLEKAPTMSNYVVIMLCLLSSVGFGAVAVGYLADDCIYWRIVHVVVLLLIIAVTTLVAETYIRILIKDNK